MRHRALLQASKIIDRLVLYIKGEVDLSPGQISVAKLILDKLLPDLGASKASRNKVADRAQITQIERVLIDPETKRR